MQVRPIECHPSCFTGRRNGTAFHAYKRRRKLWIYRSRPQRSVYGEREIAQALKNFGTSAKEATSTATAILSQLEGALLLARIYRNLDSMRRAEDALRLLVGRDFSSPDGSLRGNHMSSWTLADISSQRQA